MGLALVRNKCFKSRILTLTGSTKAQLIVINTLFNIMGSLGNHNYIFIVYNPLLRILRGKIYYYRT